MSPAVWEWLAFVVPFTVLALGIALLTFGVALATREKPPTKRHRRPVDAPAPTRRADKW